MLLIFIRTVILYVLVLFVIRFMGKREIGQMQPFELVIAIMIADLASTPMGDIGTPLLYGIIPILSLLMLHIVISILNLKSIKIREIICGKPRILIYRGKIDEKAMVAENFTINELQERLRVNNVSNLGDVEFAILETSGQISVVLKPEKRALCPKDFNINAQYEGIAYDLVIDGKVMIENLDKLGKDYNWLETEVGKFNIKPEEALVVVLNGDNSIFCQKKEMNRNGN